jgi:hypothetical protein
MGTDRRAYYVEIEEVIYSVCVQSEILCKIPHLIIKFSDKYYKNYKN